MIVKLFFEIFWFEIYWLRNVFTIFERASLLSKSLKCCPGKTIFLQSDSGNPEFLSDQFGFLDYCSFWNEQYSSSHELCLQEAARAAVMVLDFGQVCVWLCYFDHHKKNLAVEYSNIFPYGCFRVIARMIMTRFTKTKLFCFYL